MVSRPSARSHEVGTPFMSVDPNGRPVVAILLSEKTRRLVLPPEAEDLLAGIAEIREPTGPDLGSEELRVLVDGADAAM